MRTKWIFAAAVALALIAALASCRSARDPIVRVRTIETRVPVAINCDPQDVPAEPDRETYSHALRRAGSVTTIVRTVAISYADWVTYATQIRDLLDACRFAEPTTTGGEK